MTSRTPFFKEFGPLLFGRAPRTAVEKIKELSSLKDLYATFGHLFDEIIFEQHPEGVVRRDRLLPGALTFWAFLFQVFSPKTSCQETVRKIEAWWRWGHWKSSQQVSASAYCKARQRLSMDHLEQVASSIAIKLENRVAKNKKWFRGRPIKIVDGTGISMPDEPSLQECWPQQSKQKQGCSFPQLKMVALFSLGSGAILQKVIGNKYQAECSLFKSLWPKLHRGDILLEDRGFCSYGAMASLLANGVDTLARLHGSKPVDLEAGQPLGPGDRLVTWSKPTQRLDTYGKEEWAALPATLTIRQIELRVEVKGFRTQYVVLVTTLLDSEVYPADQLRELYKQRWQIETHFAQIKTTLAMDVLRCKSPEMIEKEIAINLIAYNLVRSLMQRAALCHGVELKRISFKGSLDTLRHYIPLIHRASKTPTKQHALVQELIYLLVQNLIPERPGRSEPRAVKRRPKNYYRLSCPRSQIGNLPHRDRPRKNSKNHPKSPLS